MCRGVDMRELSAAAALHASAAAASGGFTKYQTPVQQQKQQQPVEPSPRTYLARFDSFELDSFSQGQRGAACSDATSVYRHAAAQGFVASSDDCMDKRKEGFLDAAIELPCFFQEDELAGDDLFQELTASFNREQAEESDNTNSYDHSTASHSPASSTATPYSEEDALLDAYRVPCFKKEGPLICPVKTEEVAPTEVPMKAVHIPDGIFMSKGKGCHSKLFDTDEVKLSKWRRRDIQKHLAGERSRRAKRMGKIHTLQAMIEGLPRKPTVNHILSAAIEEIHKVMASGEKKTTRAAQPPVVQAPAFVEMKEIMRSSPFLSTLVLDSNNNVVEASRAMLQLIMWPGSEDSIKGRYLASIMHPNDAVALMNEAEWFRSTPASETSAHTVRVAVKMSRFVPVDGFDASSIRGLCCAFPQDYTPVMWADVSICKNSMFVSVDLQGQL